VYARDRATLPDGFEPYAGFLAKLGDVREAREDGLVPFSLGSSVSAPGFAKAGFLRLRRSEYFFNPRNGMILPETMTAGGDRRADRSVPHFVAQVLERDGRIVVVFGGTVTFQDWKENLMQIRGITPPQFRLASRLVNAIARSTDMPIHMIGHSEGGGEVQYCYLRNFAALGARLTGSTFNSQRLSARLLRRVGDDARRGAMLSVVHYRMANDVVSGLRSLGTDLQGTVLNLGRAGGMLFPFALLLAHNLRSVFKSLLPSPSDQGRKQKPA
jgi:hypothetical protein